ncbi:unnamed protein product [Withania somnifera]
MTYGKRVAFEGDSEDRISDLPRNVLDHIIELLPIQDAARTSILLRNWRYIWATLPNLKKSQSKFKEAVDGILLMHTGDIIKFVLNATGARLSSYAIIDRWMFYVTRNGVKTLTLRISNDDTYTLPSSIFNCSTLRHLKLSNCVLKPPSPFLGFQNLICLYLETATFMPTTSCCFIKAPLLANLTLDLCHGTQYLNIVSPGLKSLYIRDSHYTTFLNCFMICKDLKEFELEFDDVFNNSKHDEKSTLDKLIVSLPALEVLHLDSFFVEHLSAHNVPGGLPFMFKSLWHLSIGVDFGKMGQIYGALQSIKSSPKLIKLDIWVRVANGNAEGVLENLNTPACFEQPLNKLKYVDIDGFESSEAELLFVKLLLSRTPSLISMCIDQYTDMDVEIALKLRHFHRASPRAKLFC